MTHSPRAIWPRSRTRLTGESQQVAATERQQVSVARLLHTSWGGDPNQRQPYDCATEPAGCVLIVAPFELPARGVLIPLEFDDIPSPLARAMRP